MAFTKTELADIYRKRAPRYDLSANLYQLMGFREHAYRTRAVDALDLKPGDTVVELGCGTGLNLPLLERAIGPNGRIIGVDLTKPMLDQARERIARQGWQNVELVQSDAAGYTLPDGLDGVISSFAITLVPEYDQVIGAAAKALKPGGKIAILDLKLPEWNPRWLSRVAVAVTRPFGVTLDLAGRHPWESVARYFNDVRREDYYFGFGYLAVGTAR